VEISPGDDQTLIAGASIDFEATAYNPQEKVIVVDDGKFNWDAEGGSLVGSGLFNETTAGIYNVTAEFVGVVSDPTTVTVVPAGPYKADEVIRTSPEYVVAEVQDIEVEIEGLRDKFDNIIEDIFDVELIEEVGDLPQVTTEDVGFDANGDASVTLTGVELDQAIAQSAYVFSIAVDGVEVGQIEVKVDPTPPTVEIVNPKTNDWTNNNQQTIEFKVTDDWSGVDEDTIVVYLGDEVFSDIFDGVGTDHVAVTYYPGTGKLTINVAYVDYQFFDGEIEVTVYAGDVAGNSATETSTFGVDTLPPVVAISVETAYVQPDGEVVVTYKLQDPDPSIGGDPSGIDSAVLRLEAADGTNFFLSPISPGEDEQATITLSDAAEGVFTVELKATDNAGNEATVTDTGIVDGIAPAVKIVNIEEAGPGNEYRGELKIEFTVEEINPFEVKVEINGTEIFSGNQDDGDEGPVGIFAFQETWDSTGVGEGDCTITVTAIDAVGNIGTDTEVDITINNTAPGFEKVLAMDGFRSIFLVFSEEIWTLAELSTEDFSVDIGNTSNVSIDSVKNKDPQGKTLIEIMVPEDKKPEEGEEVKVTILESSYDKIVDAAGNKLDDPLIQITTAVAAQVQTVVYDADDTFIVPSGAFLITVEAWGGGGAGGGKTFYDGAQPGGGGGGAYAISTINVTPGDTYEVGVGEQVSGTIGDGSDGNPSYFGLGDGTVVYAAAGKGGTSAGIGGVGGAVDDSIGDIVHKGGDGANEVSRAGIHHSGGGGGGAGTTGPGGDAVGTTAGSGTTDGGGNGGAGRTTYAPGYSGSEAGGGGGAAGVWLDEYSGGDGARGKVRVTYIGLENP